MISCIGENELSTIVFNTSKLKVPSVDSNRISRKDVIFIRNGKKFVYFYFKTSAHFNAHLPPPFINICHQSHIFIQSISIDTFEEIYIGARNNVTTSIV